MLGPEEENDMIKECLAGNRKAQALLFKTFSAKMYGICITYAKNRDAAQDILQESFIKIFKNLHLYTHDTSIEKWIRRIVVNTAIDHYRKSIKAIWFNSEFIDESYPTIQEDTLSRINEKQLLTIIETLPKGYKIIFNLFVIEGFSHKEISEMLEISEGTSKSQFFHAKKMLKEKIAALYGESEFLNEGQPFVVHGQELFKLVRP